MNREDSRTEESAGSRASGWGCKKTRSIRHDILPNIESPHLDPVPNRKVFTLQNYFHNGISIQRPIRLHLLPCVKQRRIHAMLCRQATKKKKEEKNQYKEK